MNSQHIHIPYPVPPDQKPFDRAIEIEDVNFWVWNPHVYASYEDAAKANAVYNSGSGLGLSGAEDTLCGMRAVAQCLDGSHGLLVGIRVNDTYVLENVPLISADDALHDLIKH